jgi:hypothetical protein
MCINAYSESCKTPVMLFHPGYRSGISGISGTS